ncbi:MAG: c-type cytochrome [Telluria sp.]
MKTTSMMFAGLAMAVLAACAGRGGAQGGGGAEVPGEPTAAQPGAQPGQAGMMQEQQAQGGPAMALGQPGAAAAQTAGPAQVQAGEQVATKGAPNGVTACITCHGAQGEGNPAGGFPRIAGQSAYCLGKQLAAYANGARVNPIMQPIAKAMNAEQIRDVAGYYATLGGGAAAVGARGTGAGRGEQLAAKGDESKRVQACANCHGPGGAGEPPIYPYLAGQHANYLTAAMAAWKSGARKTDQSGQMLQIAYALSDADVAALSAYFSSQPAPPPASRRVNVASGSTVRPAVAATPGAPGPHEGGAAGAGVTGSGTEQGAPVMGGSQGAGGGGGTQGTKPPEPPVRH